MSDASAGVGDGLRPPEPLGEHHDLTAFACGRDDLDRWLKERARDSEGRSARTYVVTRGDRVVAFHCVSAGSVVRSSLPRRLRHGNPDPVPLIVIGRLAVDSEFHGRGLGSGLLKDALSRALAASRAIGVRAVLVHAIDDEAAAFYARFGFLPSPIDARTLMLPIDTIAAAL